MRMTREAWNLARVDRDDVCCPDVIDDVVRMFLDNIHHRRQLCIKPTDFLVLRFVSYILHNFAVNLAHLFLIFFFVGVGNNNNICAIYYTIYDIGLFLHKHRNNSSQNR